MGDTLTHSGYGSTWQAEREAIGMAEFMGYDIGRISIPKFRLPRDMSH